MTILLFYQIVTRYRSIDKFAALTATISEYHAVVAAGVIFLVNYILLAHKFGYRKIIKEFEGESSQHRKLGNVLVTSYIIGSPVLFIGCLVLGTMRY